MRMHFGVNIMKRKLLIMSLSAMVCLTVSSCDIIGGFLPSQGLTEKEARTYTQDVEKNTREHLSLLANGPSYYVTFNESLSANYDVKFRSATTFYNQVEESHNYGTISSNGNGNAYLDLANIRSSQLGTSNINFSGSLNTWLSEASYGKVTNNNRRSIQVMGDKSNLEVKTNENGNESSDSTSINGEDEILIANVINNIVSATGNQSFDLSTIIGIEGQTISWKDYDEFQTKTNQFKDKEITSAEYLDYVDSKFFGDILENELDDESYALIIKVLDKQEAILPEYYFNYTKEQSASGAVLHAAFNYDLWKLAFQTAIVEIAAEEVENLEELMDDIEEMASLYMPTKFDWEYDLASDSNGVFAGYNLLLDVEGVYKSEQKWSYGDQEYFDTTEITYEVYAQMSFNFKASGAPIA